MHRIIGVLLAVMVCGAALPAQDARARYLKTRIGREKAVLLDQNGGSAATEKAVAAALEFFRLQQEKDGRWSPEELVKRLGDNPPRLADSKYKVDDTSIDVPMTGMALLCFSGAGPDAVRQYQDTYIPGLKYLRSMQKDDGGFGGKNYTNAICAMALLEAYAVTGDKEVRAAAEKTVNLLISRQCDMGGWGYTTADKRNDTSVTGWVVWALSMADDLQVIRHKPAPRDASPGPRYADGALGGAYKLLEEVLPVFKDNRVFDDALYLNRSFTPNGEGNHPRANLTAAATFCLITTGNMRKDPRVFTLGNRILGTLLPSPQQTPWYGWHYAAEACFQIGGAYWSEWNKHMSFTLVKLQKADGPALGSWDPTGDFAAESAGRFFSTAIGCLCLETYYRFPRRENLSNFIPADFPAFEPKPLPEDPPPPPAPVPAAADQPPAPTEGRPAPPPPPPPPVDEPLHDGDSF